MPGLIDRVRRRIHRLGRRSPDPFITLELQVRLSRLSAELDALARGETPTFALGHHARAATLAYEATLAEACALIGEDVPEGSGASRRLVMEACLVNAGWSW